MREFTRADTFRKVNRVEKALASTVIRVPHVLNYIVQKRRSASNLINTFKDYGVTAINITLNERTLSDNFTFDIASRQMEINEEVRGTLLDYPFKFLVEETNQRDLVQTVKGMYNQDTLLYTQFFLPTVEIDEKEEVEPCHASSYVANTAAYIGLTADIKIDDFTPYNLSGESRITYADLLSSIFGWTSRLPQRLINVFIRGGVLYCIQRGKEENVFDITDLPHSRPTVNKKLIRSLWNNPKSDNGKDENENDDPTIEYMYDEYAEPFSGTIRFSGDDYRTTLTYQRGLLKLETNYTANSKTTLESSTSYSYIEIFAGMTDLQVSIKKSLDKNFYGEFYIAKKKLNSSADTMEDKEKKKVSQQGTTVYSYTAVSSIDLYLDSEIEDITTKTYELDKGNWKLTDTDEALRETFHVPIGNGWYGQTVYHNGECQGSNISQGKPGNRVSQYTIGEVQKIFKGWKIIYDNPNNPDNPNADKETYDDWRRKLAPIADISFPVRELNIVEQLTSDLLWLNRKIEETITIDLIAKVDNGVPSINHIVDFTERIKFNGAEYFLVYNNISFTPRKLIQKLQLIRWY